MRLLYCFLNAARAAQQAHTSPAGLTFDKKYGRKWRSLGLLNVMKLQRVRGVSPSRRRLTRNKSSELLTWMTRPSSSSAWAFVMTEITLEWLPHCDRVRKGTKQSWRSAIGREAAGRKPSLFADCCHRRALHSNTAVHLSVNYQVWMPRRVRKSPFCASLDMTWFVLLSLTQVSYSTLQDIFKKCHHPNFLFNSVLNEWIWDFCSTPPLSAVAWLPVYACLSVYPKTQFIRPEAACHWVAWCRVCIYTCFSIKWQKCRFCQLFCFVCCFFSPPANTCG